MKTWAISGVDLHLDLSGTRVRSALESALRDAIRSGRLTPGLALPSSRALAGDLGISRNTVASAYGQLVVEGWLTARRGGGTRVAERPALPAPESRRATEDPVRPRYDLRPGSPDVAAFPRSAWLASARRALGKAPAEALGYGDPRGRPELRRALAGYLARSRGVYADPERIVICSGFAQGLPLLCEVLLRRGATAMAIEAYGHRSHREAIAASGFRPRALPVDRAGADVASLGDCAAVVLTPAHQFPLGPALAADRRSAVVEWARRTGGLIVEDDYDGEFRYDRQPVGAMQALAPEHIVYAGTASKSLAPGLRLGWLVLPEGLVAPVVETRQLTGGPSTVEQLTMADLIDSGAYDRQVRRARLTYRRRRDALVATLGRRVPAARVTGIAAGLHAVVELPPGRAEPDVVADAGRNGLMLEGLGAYAQAGHTEGSAVVVGYGTPADHAFAATLDALCAALSPDRRVSRSSRSTPQPH